MYFFFFSSQVIIFNRDDFVCKRKKKSKTFLGNFKNNNNDSNNNNTEKCEFLNPYTWEAETNSFFLGLKKEKFSYYILTTALQNTLSRFFQRSQN